MTLRVRLSIDSDLLERLNKSPEKTRGFNFLLDLYGLYIYIYIEQGSREIISNSGWATRIKPDHRGRSNFVEDPEDPSNFTKGVKNPRRKGDTARLNEL